MLYNSISISFRSFVLTTLSILYSADPGKARESSTNIVVIHSFLKWVTLFPAAFTVLNGGSSQKIDYAVQV